MENLTDVEVSKQGDEKCWNYFFQAETKLNISFLKLLISTNTENCWLYNKPTLQSNSTDGVEAPSVLQLSPDGKTSEKHEFCADVHPSDISNFRLESYHASMISF